VKAVEEYISLKVTVLKEFAVSVFTKLGVPVDDAKIAAEVLIAADQRGVYSHGLQRLKRYTRGLKTGVMKPVAEIKIVKETPNTLVISGGDGLGQVIAYKTMKLVIDKALKHNIAFAVVRDSNHYGIAGYYSMMALEHDLIGFSVTNSVPCVVPTHGKNAVMGTNPISVAVPVGKGCPFVLDMATSTVPQGKLEVYERQDKKIPVTWATDEFGHETQDPSRVLINLLGSKGGGLLPLGGAGEENGGHKGYGLCLAVDILSGVLSGSLFGVDLFVKENTPAKLSHFLGALKIDAFIEPALFRNNMDKYKEMLKNSEKANGHNRIFIHGEKELERYEEQKEEVRIFCPVVEELRKIGEEVGIRTLF
jgi:LDH2 family malate/lactate/ureidoglycolate dehydrogenase